MKWLWIILLIIVGIVAAVFAYEYLSTSLGHLPSWVPGHAARFVSVNGKCKNKSAGTGAYIAENGYCYKTGHSHKRGYAAALVAVVAFVWAGWLIYKNQAADKAETPAATV